MAFRYSQRLALLYLGSSLDARNTLFVVFGRKCLFCDHGKLAEAEPLLMAAWRTRRVILGDEHSDMLTSMNNVALLFVDQGKLAEAEPLLMVALRTRRAALGDGHPDTLTSMDNLRSKTENLRPKSYHGGHSY